MRAATLSSDYETEVIRENNQAEEEESAAAQGSCTSSICKVTCTGINGEKLSEFLQSLSIGVSNNFIADKESVYDIKTTNYRSACKLILNC